MKPVAALLVALTLLAAPPSISSARNPQSAPAAALVWPLDNLSTIGGHAVKVVGSPKVVDTDVGKAIEFNGKTDGLFLDVNPIAGLKAFTVEVVFAPASEGVEEQRFLHIAETGSENRLMMETRLLPGAVWSLDTFLKSGDASRALLDRAVTHRAGRWYVAALTYDGQTMTHFVDGVRELSGPVDFKTLGRGPTSLGVRQNLVSWFSGRIARVRVSPSVLTPAQMLTATR
jgi:hypothetical protein